MPSPPAARRSWLPRVTANAAVLTLIDLQPLLPVAALGRHGNALDVSGRTIGKVDVDEHVARNSGGEHAPDDVGTEADRRFPMGRLVAARPVGLRQCHRRNAE